MRHYAILFLGIVCCSSSVIFIKKSDIHPILLASYRTLLAAILLCPITFKILKNDIHKVYIKAAIIPGVLLALHFISWIYGARTTLAANSSLIVNMTPLISPFLLFLIAKERVTKNEIIGTMIAFAGVIILSIHDYNLKPKYFIGDLICFGSMLLFSSYLVYARKNKTLPSTLSYVTCVYAICGIFCLLVAITLNLPLFTQLNSNNIWQIINLAVITTLLGHNMLNIALKNIRGQIVSILNQGQFIPAGVMAYFILSETPTASFYFATVLLFLGSFMAIKKSQLRKKLFNK